MLIITTGMLLPEEFAEVGISLTSFQNAASQEPNSAHSFS
jgi:hypothetical protein